jgi:PAS domain S-box-containing protein
MSMTQILIVEDEGIVATAIKRELEHFGYSVSGIASSANEAVEKATHDRPDLVLMDIRLHGEDSGIEAARQIYDRCRVPIIYLSAFADNAVLARARDTGAFGYLVKPYEEQELHTTIEMVLAKHAAEQRLEETERWLSAILNGISDAVIATDPDKRVRVMNAGSESLTGWQRKIATGVPLEAVCTLVSEGGSLRLEDVAARAICESRAMELPRGTRLVSRDGQETPIEGRAAIIWDSRDEFLGMLLTFRNAILPG